MFVIKIYGLQKLSLLDYPEKTACTIFTGGCNWRCPFCHNASLVTNLNDANTIDEEDVFCFLSKRQNILDGVCISGGEPLMQPDIIEFVNKIKSLGYSIKIDTNGSYPKVLEELINKKLVDYVAMDIKNSPENYPKTVGLADINLSNIIQSAAILKTNKVDYEFRTTVVKEFHISEDFNAIAQWLKGANKYYLQSFVDSGNIIGNNFSAYTKEELEGFKAILSLTIQNVEIRGM